mmetsp:Transcript_47466/g.92686  ORF Transcript_47466/g.92686 Transcript_47466/m.92686 type:complete len:424 (+) Transcript_47466:155-1426(+)
MRNFSVMIKLFLLWIGGVSSFVAIFPSAGRTAGVLRMTSEGPDVSDGGGEDGRIDPSSLGDWRKFRADLISGGIKTTEDEASPNDERPTAAAHKTVSPGNEVLLSSQNPDLFADYMEGNWAHAVPVPEVGGLIIRMPFEMELHRKSLLADEKKGKIGRAASLLRERLSSSGTDAGAVDLLATAMWFRSAEGVIEEEMKRIAGGLREIRLEKLSAEDRQFTMSYMDYQSKWQEVALVVGQDEEAGTVSYVNINRPLRLSLSDDNPIAELVLFGASPTRVNDRGALIKFMVAFEEKCAVYLGGPDEQTLPATMIHGIADLPGATEIAPGTGIFEGGVTAACEGVIAGKYRPLDFRFFVGKQVRRTREAAVAVAGGAYTAVACARPVALKQCIGLPKPLWHEIMELCGGEMEALSKLELLKRTDLK